MTSDLLPRTSEEIEAHNRGERDGLLGPSRWTDIYKPIICAINGVAYGQSCFALISVIACVPAGGLEWACFGDIRIAEEHASFGCA